MVRRSLLALLLAPSLLLAQPARGRAPSYHVARRILIGGEGGWDYLVADSAAHRLYLSRSTHVLVLNTDTDSVMGDIPGTAGVHGVALARDLGRGFTSNGRDSTVTIFDLTSLAREGTVTVPARNPDAILFEPVSRLVFTFNGGSASATAIDAITGNVVGTIALGGKPEAAVSDTTGRVLVNIEDRSEIVAFNARTLAVTAHWPLAPCEEPTGLAFDRAHDRLFAGCSNSLLAVVDAASGRVVATVPIGQGVDGVAFDPATQLVFSTNGEGTVSVIHEDTPDSYTVVATVPTERGARTIALDERTHKVYTVTAQFGPTPAPSADRPHTRPPIVPGTFVVLVLAPDR
jgi:DNA-binding beta-propeller fold protein YncE